MGAGLCQVTKVRGLCIRSVPWGSHFQRRSQNVSEVGGAGKQSPEAEFRHPGSPANRLPVWCFPSW